MSWAQLTFVTKYYYYLYKFIIYFTLLNFVGGGMVKEDYSGQNCYVHCAHFFFTSTLAFMLPL